MAKTYIDKLLGQHERILLITHQHWLILFRSILVEIFIILILIVASALVAIFLQPPPLLLALVAVVLILIPLLGALRDFAIWWNKEYIVTNRRVIQIAGIFNKDVTDSSLEKVNDVKMDQSALGRLFDYGDIEILTASELGANLFKMISQPVRFKTVMLNAKEELDSGREHREQNLDDIPAMIARLDQLRQQGVLTSEEFQAKKSELLSKL